MASAGQPHLSAQEISLASRVANAGYAVGTALAVQFARHLPQRRMLLVYGLLLVIGAVLAAAAAGPAMFIAGTYCRGCAPAWPTGSAAHGSRCR